MICPIHHTEFVCPICASLQQRRKGGLSRSEKKVRASSKNLEKARAVARQSSPDVWSAKDTLSVFQAAPTEIMRSADVLKKATPKNRDNAKINIPHQLVSLYNQKILERVEEGAYCLKKNNSKK
jgi:hypothetical protein